MNTTYSIVVGDRGRLVLPAELRAKHHWQQGTTLLLIETDDAVVLATREQAKSMLRSQLAGANLVETLLEERRAMALTEDLG